VPARGPAALTAYLAAGERKFERWYATLASVEVAFDDQPEAFENINTREELARFPDAPAKPWARCASSFS
jgi:molybdenum cofactor guanylyltransferase